MQPVFSQPTVVEGRFGVEHELRVSGCSDQLFQTWVQQSPDADLCAYFRAVSDGIASRALDNYHFKVCNGRYNFRTRSQDQQWHIMILYGGAGAEGPLLVSRCMSCDMDCPLILGVVGEQPTTAAAAADSPDATTGSAATAQPPEPAVEAATSSTQLQTSQTTATVGPVQQQSPASKDSLIKETEHSRVWLDAKARPMFIVTPKQHLEKLSDLSDAELVDLFRTAVAVISEMGCNSFNTMVLNHGDNRNHAHLHLKVRIHEREFERAAEGWSPKHKAQLQLLRKFRDSLPEENRGTHKAFELRMQHRQQQQQHGQQRGQHWQRQHPQQQQRPYRQQRPY